MKKDRAFRVVLRHLHHTTDLEELRKELKIKGLEVRNIYNIRHRVFKKPLSQQR